jgi:hypothetical protein
MSHVSVPYVSIRPSYIAIYSRPEGSRQRSALQTANEVNLQETATRGLISRKAERRIKQGIDWLLYLTKTKTFYHYKHKKHYNFKINFVTLTLPSKQVHSDKQIKKECLDHMLTILRQKYKVQHYLWRAEPQKNGNIHFHIVTDKFIPWSELRDHWNNITNKLGYVDKFKQKWNHRNPNSTDVHSIQKIGNISAYLAKYCTKQSSVRAIEGKLWGLSTSLSKMKSSIEMRCNDIDAELNEICAAFPNRVLRMEYITIIYRTVKQWSQVVKGRLYSDFKTYMDNAANGIFEQPPPVPVYVPKTNVSPITYISANKQLSLY